MSVADLLTRVRLDYNDIDADRIEDPLIVDYLNEAVAEIFKLNPSLFLKTVVAKQAIFRSCFAARTNPTGFYA